MRRILAILAASALLAGSNLALGADECGFKAVQARWSYPAFPGLKLHTGDSEGMGFAMFVPPGKDTGTADRTLGIAASPKAEFGALSEFTRKTNQFYFNMSEGGTMTDVGTTPGPDDKPITLYQLKKGPKTPENTFHHISAYLEDSHCFIDVFFSAKSAQVHEANVAAFKQFLSKLKPR